MNWEQLRAIVWLRWRLSWNRFARAGTLNAVVAVILMAMFVTGTIASGIGGLLAGALVLPKQSGQVWLAVWDGVMVVFLFFWLAGLVAEIQRAESIDIPKLLHLPVTIQQVFLFNYFASHLTPAILLCVPGMLGLSVGLAAAAGLRMALLIPLILSFVFMLSSWTYFLRGWLSALMVNKRKRRAIIVWITVGFVLIFQLPGLLINSFVIHKKAPNRNQVAESTSETGSQDATSALPKNVVRAHRALPVGWPGYGAMCLKQHNPSPAIAAAGVSLLVGALGLWRSYRSTIRFYQGAETGTTRLKFIPSQGANPRGKLLVERSLPWVPDDTAALALATLRSLLRAPELKMSMIMPIIAGAGLGSMRLSRLAHMPSGPLTGFATTIAAILAVFSFAPVMANLFGLDRNGFRCLVLLPMSRGQVLMAKNLALLPLVCSVGLALLLLATFMLHLSWHVFGTGLLQVLIAFILFSLMCNVVSILTPYKIATGKLQAKKPKPVVFLALGLTMMGMPIVLAPTVIPPMVQWLCSFVSGVPASLPLDVISGVLVLIGVAGLYWILLPAQGRLLQRREQKILVEVTEDLE